MKKLYDGVQRFCAAHPRFGIPNLMRVIVIGNAAVYILSMLTMYTNPAALDFLKFNLNGLLHGEIWRIVKRTLLMRDGFALVRVGASSSSSRMDAVPKFEPSDSSMGGFRALVTEVSNRSTGTTSCMLIPMTLLDQTMLLIC